MKVSSDHLGDIKLFIAITEEKSLTAAAQRFGFSVAAASIRLSKLEKYLGVRLINRSTKKIELTTDGENYLKSCTAAISLLDEAEFALKTSQISPTGNIRISACTDFGRNYLFEWLDEFFDKYPDVRISLMLEDSCSDGLQDDIDLAIRFGRPCKNTLVVKLLAANYRVLCASPRYLNIYGIPKNPEDLNSHEFIAVLTKKGVQNEYYFEHNGAHASFTLPQSNTWEVSDGELATKWAVAGRGITRKTIWDAVRHLRSGDLKIVLDDYIKKEDGVYIVRHNSKHIPRRVRLLVDFIENKFARESERLGEFLSSSQ
ncbi:MAG: LysR family transcriptional regulator [Burkholderiaceae bacterium]|jgi:DNA-binding transcriptional LysR family regulator|nr:LysR family transcriptional regulator [Burkholderiaceae bacterium]